MLTRSAKQGLSLLAVAVLAVVLAAPPTHAQKMEKTSIAYPVLAFSQAVNFIAKDMGFWKQEGVEVDLKLVRGIGASNAVLSGSVDFSTGSGPTVIRANVRGRKMIALLVINERPAYEFVLHKDVVARLGVSPNASIEERMAALKGLRIAITGLNNVLHAFTNYLAQKGGINTKTDVKLTTMRPPNMIAALRTKDIDGYGSGIPWPYESVKTGEGVRWATGLNDWASGLSDDVKELVPFTNTVLITRQGFPEKEPSICRKVVKGYQQALKYVHENPEGALKVMQRWFPKMDPALLKKAFDEMVLVVTSKSGGKFPPGGLEGAQEFMVKAGIMKAEKKLKAMDAIYTSKFIE